MGKRERFNQLKERLKAGAQLAATAATVATGVMIISAPGGINPDTNPDQISIVSAKQVDRSQMVTSGGDSKDDNGPFLAGGWNQTWDDAGRGFSNNWTDWNKS